MLGITNCEAAEGDYTSWLTEPLNSHYITGMASNHENLNLERGLSTLETMIEVVPTGEQVINLPDVSG